MTDQNTAAQLEPRFAMYGMQCGSCGHPSRFITYHAGRVVTAHDGGHHVCVSDPTARPSVPARRGPYKPRKHLRVIR